MTNAELIKVLRKCGKQSPDRCWDCDYYDREPWCESALMTDVADTLEAADKRIKELESQSAFFDAEKQNYQENIVYRDERIKELETHLPKEGEWIDIKGTMFAECSVCGSRHYGCNTPYCDMCGARMRGERDEQ